MEYKKFGQKIKDLQSDWAIYKVEFMNRDSFKVFADDLCNRIGCYPEVCITGYFSESIRDQLEKLMPRSKLRLISPELNRGEKRDSKNLEVMKKLAKKGAEIRINNRMHARFLIGHNPKFPNFNLLILGSFDFNTECIGKERYDAGIKTENPDLVASALELFEQIWNEPESINLLEKYHEND